MSRYRVEMAGHVGSRFQNVFDVVVVEMGRGRTILTVDLPDQAALQGLLEMAGGAGIELLAVNRTDVPAVRGAAHPGERRPCDSAEETTSP
ncbi:hypothetical protein [Miltoncostaea oceani]|uniref:hypothetical protein n=1 Tax=Miltoncostaea oceani TaxID=2843216 RepID=UPI001C3D5E0B|nr:hypothetical protein [Miltoncostaea oceani]